MELFFYGLNGYTFHDKTERPWSHQQDHMLLELLDLVTLVTLVC